MTETPWSSWDEWRSVKSLLYSSHPAARRDGCNRVSAWNLRGNKTQLPIRCTVDIIEAQLLDESKVGTLEQIRLAYSMALVRLVNNAADDGQRGDYAQSIASLAAKINLPKWLVDVRHESTHQVLPSIQVLRLSASQALQWLSEHYWTKQEAEIEHIHPERLDKKFKLVHECLKQGLVSRDIGPRMHPQMQMKQQAVKVEDDDNIDENEETEPITPSKGERVLTAQDLIDGVKNLEVNRLAKALYRAICLNEDEDESTFDWIVWERVIHWLDGENSLRVSRKLLMVCITEIVRGVLNVNKSRALLRGLLSRRFHSINRPTLAKLGSKTLSLETSDSWTKKESTYMESFATDVFLEEIAVATKYCFAIPNQRSLALLVDVLVPILMRKKPVDERNSMIQNLREMFELREELVNGDDGDKSDRAFSMNHEEDGESSKKDWQSLASFCDQHEAVMDTSKVSGFTDINSLAGNGNQPWTTVDWPSASIGANLRDRKACPALTLAPVNPDWVCLRIDDAEHDEAESEGFHASQDAMMIQETELEATWDKTLVDSIAKKIRLLA